jgi:AraC family transcriptional regulator
MRISYRQMSPTSVFYARATGPYASSCEEAWRRLDGWLDRYCARGRVRRAFGIFHDNPRTTPPELMRYDACVPLAACAELEPNEGIGRHTLPTCTWAVYTHVGPHCEAGDVISTLHGDLIPKRGLTVDHDRPILAVYLNDPRVTREVHRRTELCIPVIPIPALVASNDGTTTETLDLPALARRLAG